MPNLFVFHVGKKKSNLLKGTYTYFLWLEMFQGRSLYDTNSGKPSEITEYFHNIQST